jgi:hypothetical protein
MWHRIPLTTTGVVACHEHGTTLSGFCQLHGTAWLPVMGPPSAPCGAAPRGACWIFTSCCSTWRSTVVVFREVDMVEVREDLRG